MSSKAIALLMTAVGLISLGPSEQIDVTFAGGSPNTQVKVTGHYADVPTLSPDQSFTWTESVGFAEPVDNPVLLASETSHLLDAFFFYESAILDARAYQSYALNMELSGGTWPVNGVLALRVIFFADAAGTVELFNEKYEFYSNSPIPLTDQMHGPWMQISVEDSNSIGNSVNLTYRLFGSYRVMSHAYLRTSDDNVLYDGLAVALAAGTNNGGAPALLGFGPAMLSMITTQVPATVDIRIQGTSVNAIRYELTATVANQRIDKLIILPRSAAWVVINNNAAAAATIRAYLIQQVQPL